MTREEDSLKACVRWCRWLAQSPSSGHTTAQVPMLAETCRPAHDPGTSTLCTSLLMLLMLPTLNLQHCQAHPTGPHRLEELGST